MDGIGEVEVSGEVDEEVDGEGEGLLTMELELERKQALSDGEEGLDF